MEALVGIYEPNPNSQLGMGEIIQRDWRLLRTADPANVAKFVRDALPKFPYETDLTFKRRPHGVSDPLQNWMEFTDEIKNTNRYHIKAIPDSSLLERAFRESTRIISSGTKFYRGRSHESDCRFPASEMGAPPKNFAVSGRANPHGIPYLYVADSFETCVYESRARELMYISIASFTTTKDIEILDLCADAIKEPDFFTDDPSEALALHDYIFELGNLLSRPIRASDGPVEYVPTQYLCEFAKSIGLDGVQYSSSLNKNGINLAIFDQTHMRVNRKVRLYAVDSNEIKVTEVP